MTETLSLSPAAAARLAGVSTATVYEAVHRGELRAKRVGRLIKILRPDVAAWLESLPDVGSDEDD